MDKKKADRGLCGRLFVCLTCLVLIYSFSLTEPFAQTVPVLMKYQQDFSTEPGGTTNNASRFHRDAGTGSFSALTVEGANEYATFPVAWTGNSFRLDFDIKITSSQWASGISIGLFDADRHDTQADVVDVIYGNSNDGLHVNLHAANASGTQSAPSSIQSVQLNVWYHNTVTWNKQTGVLTLDLTVRDTGVLVGQYTISGFTSFSPTMTNLGVSWVGHNASSNQTQSYLDTVVFLEDACTNLSSGINPVLPLVGLGLNQSSFHGGQPLLLTAATAPGASPVAADAYVALAIPGSPLLFLRGDGSFTTAWQPIVSNWTVGTFSGVIFSYTFSGAKPTGSYSWYAAFTARYAELHWTNHHRAVQFQSVTCEPAWG